MVRLTSGGLEGSEKTRREGEGRREGRREERKEGKETKERTIVFNLPSHPSLNESVRQ